MKWTAVCFASLAHVVCRCGQPHMLPCTVCLQDLLRRHAADLPGCMLLSWQLLCPHLTPHKCRLGTLCPASGGSDRQRAACCTGGCWPVLGGLGGSPQCIALLLSLHAQLLLSSTCHLPWLAWPQVMARHLSMVADRRSARAPHSGYDEASGMLHETRHCLAAPGRIVPD